MEIPYRVIADKEKNRLYIELCLTEEEQAENIVDEIFDKAKQLKAEWGCIADYTGVNVQLTKYLIEKAETVMSFLRPLGMGQLVRVLTEKQFSLNDELKKRSIKIGGYEGIVAQSIQDANTILDCIPNYLSYRISRELFSNYQPLW